MPSSNDKLADLPPTCPHERRPGTTVCVRCRHEARIAARGRQKTFAVRAGGFTIAGAVVVALGAVAFAQGRARVASHRGAAPGTPRVQTLASAAADSVTLAGEAIPSDSAAAAIESPTAALAPVLPHGVTILADSAVVTVSDTLIAVDFDEMMLRTRRAAKFEDFLRRTLPLIYGEPVARALSRMPNGDLASQGNLITELPRTGIRIPLDNSRVLTVWPETRQGEDGPLVIRYRVTIS